MTDDEKTSENQDWKERQKIRYNEQKAAFNARQRDLYRQKKETEKQKRILQKKIDAENQKRQKEETDRIKYSMLWRELTPASNIRNFEDTTSGKSKPKNPFLLRMVESDSEP